MAEAMNVDEDMVPDARPGWQDYLRPEHYNVHLHALNYTVTKRLGLYLDMDVEDVNPNGVIGDFGGLAELIGFDSLEIQGFERVDRKGRTVLEEWKNRQDLNPTVGRLVEFLLVMGREDILTDMHLLICADVEFFLSRPERFAQREAPIQDETVTPGPGHYDDIPRLLTVDEVQTGVQILYDAFVCYNVEGNSKMDLDFVKEMAGRLEAAPHNLKLFVPYRDDLVGLNTHKITTTIIAERCRHMIVVLSHNFLESESAEFQSHFAFCLSPSARKRRIVPVRLDDCPTPNIMKIMSFCDFTKKDIWDWSWNRLAFSLTRPLTADDFVLHPDNEGMAETETADADSAIGSMPSSSQSHTAPLPITSRGPVASPLGNSELPSPRPYTINFLKTDHLRKTSSNPNLSTSSRSTASPQPSTPKSPSNPNLCAVKPPMKSHSISIVQRLEKFIKNPKKNKTATTSF